MPSKKKPRGKRAVTIRAAEKHLKIRAMTTKEAEKFLKKALPELNKEIARLEEAKKISPEVWNFRFD
ncbi:MAG: hypothetical protein A2431_00940 [Candidatus Zambryskibacteria bacterium RIFOXYC1_FULL_39_10]|uniref:Uncharacterized protein n=1 Tax=Candidatus Zambryskibacteria bacterium RIFOXYC1_FULL_39_10 TaxID=1802779 RepID=A0A1G2V2F8_9BACT|nr:MAG: hypothetical protein A2431_00940 [Candidatus Zambryskibacteria bacterium RIFOXYC1_FULL_39_10]OHB16866.1 MAG: hypothetical protein A2605_00150 [Candidatus Zambryskibacteria bacterium RIFOXYD1_FULL_39_35]